jgi:hypothetical protein
MKVGGVYLKQSIKKGLALLVAVLLLLTLLPMTALAAGTGDFTVTGGTFGTDYTYSANMLTFLEPGDYTVEMRSGVTSTATDRIVVNASGSSAGSPVRITLSSVDIRLSTGSAFDIQGGSTVTL